VTIPAATGTGTYYVLAKADADAAVTETWESNNVKFSLAIAIGADLVVSSLTVPSTAGAGQAIVVTDTTKNQGAGAAPASTTTFYLSANVTLEGSDALLGSRSIPPLAAGGTNSASTSVTIPAATTTGTYYVLAKADADNAVVETFETNNVKISFSVRVGPDLIVTVVTAPITAVAGTIVTVSNTTKNQGGGGAPGSTTSFYLSTNVLLDASDTLLGMRPVGSLGPGLSDSGSIAVTIPRGTPAGSYYIIAAADSAGAIVETLETNNTLARWIQISAAP
jgi:subtilase family serine protease